MEKKQTTLAWTFDKLNEWGFLNVKDEAHFKNLKQLYQMAYQRELNDMWGAYLAGLSEEIESFEDYHSQTYKLTQDETNSNADPTG